MFVDSLLQVKPLPEGELARLRQELPAGSGTQALLGNASELLSAMTHFVGVVGVPKREQFAFRHIDFVSLDATACWPSSCSPTTTCRTASCTRAARGTPASSNASPITSTSTSPAARCRTSAPRCVHELRAARLEMETLLAHTVELAEQALAPGGGDDVVLAGQTRLMGVQDLSDLDRLRDLFEAFSRKREILQLLERTARAPGVRIFIGEESGVAPLESVSLVTAPYGAGGRVLGVLGVIGPTRMAYDRVIPVVQAAAGVLGEGAWSRARGVESRSVRPHR